MQRHLQVRRRAEGPHREELNEMIDYYEITRATMSGRILERQQYPSRQAALGAYPRQLVLGPDDDGSRVVRLLAVEGEYKQTLIKSEGRRGSGEAARPLGNRVAREGQDRCHCGCKYWENDRCIDCGTEIATLLAAHGEVRD